MIISKKYGFKRDAVRLLTLEGSCSIGHRRRMSEVTMEAPCFIGDETVLEAREIRGFCMVGRRCDIRRTLRIGRYTTIGNYCCIGSRSGWKNAYLSNSMVLRKGQDDWYAGIYGWKDENKIPLEKKNPVVIGNDVWIGDNVTIYEGVSVGDGAVIQSGSVVSGDVEPYSVVWPGGGKTGKVFEEAAAEALLYGEWWEYPLEVLDGLDKEDRDICRLMHKLPSGEKGMQNWKKLVFCSLDNEIFFQDGPICELMYKL